MTKREWEAIEDSNCDMHALRIGGAVAYANGPCRCGCGEGPRWDVGEDEGPADTFDHAKQLAEGKLREMRDALVEHFAPVLRWEHDGTSWVATLGAWRLVAYTQCWQLRLDGELLREGEHESLDARRAAEAALRALGVAFRTEGE